MFFDNLQVSHTRGPVIEENHYYPFGLTTAGIGSKALAFDNPDNKLKFNGGSELQTNEFSDGTGLELYETPFRGYDPQIGRFAQIDPLAELANDWNPFSFSFNNPVKYNDPLGLTPNMFDGPENITGWVQRPNGQVYFDPNIHKQDDLDPNSGLVYVGEEILIKNKNGDILGHGNDQGTVSFNVNLQNVTVTSHEKSPQKGYAWYEFFNDHNPGGDFLYELNKWNPIAQLANGIWTYATGHDSYGVQQTNSEATFQIITAFPIFKLGKVVNVLGSTGRVVALNLTEQLAMQEIMSNPNAGRILKDRLMNDQIWHHSEGWVKMAYNSAGVEIHYVAQWKNGVIQAVDDFKFK